MFYDSSKNLLAETLSVLYFSSMSHIENVASEAEHHPFSCSVVIDVKFKSLLVFYQSRHNEVMWTRCDTINNQESDFFLH